MVRSTLSRENLQGGPKGKNWRSHRMQCFKDLVTLFKIVILNIQPNRNTLIEIYARASTYFNMEPIEGLEIVGHTQSLCASTSKIWQNIDKKKFLKSYKMIQNAQEWILEGSKAHFVIQGSQNICKFELKIIF